MTRIGIIGGSGLYDIEGINHIDNVLVNTPFGFPSDEFVIGELQGREIVFLPRHGKGHKILPSQLNFRANIYGMKKLGVERIISLTAVGSLKEELKPRDLVIPNQFVDRTNQARKQTFFGDGIAAHITFAQPICEELAKIVYHAAKGLDADVHFGGTYLNMEGPAFSTLAESNLYRSWGMDIIGMTNLAEAKLAREAEICYCTVALVTDYDCWRQEEQVSVEMIIKNLLHNVANAKKLIKSVLAKIPEKRECPCSSALKDAIITDLQAMPEETKRRLELIIGKYVR